jgi:hypothetical protein
MDKIIKTGEKFDLSGADILRITDEKCNVIQYEELERVNNINEILNPYGAVVILYTTRKNFGHWVCLFKTKGKNNELEFFDPYGLEMDEELNITNELHLRQHDGLITPHLTALIQKSDYHVRSNTKQLQKFIEHVNTCGRWVSLRLRLRDLSLRQYIMMMTQNKEYDGDFWVTALTIFV